HGPFLAPRFGRHQVADGDPPVGAAPVEGVRGPRSRRGHIRIAALCVHLDPPCLVAPRWRPRTVRSSHAAGAGHSRMAAAPPPGGTDGAPPRGADGGNVFRYGSVPYR